MEDLITYLGKKISDENSANYIKIPESETAIDAKHMEIQYRDDKYYVRDNGSESGTFFRIDKPLKLIPGYIFAFAESSMAEIGRASCRERGSSPV